MNHERTLCRFFECFAIFLKRLYMLLLYLPSWTTFAMGAWDQSSSRLWFQTPLSPVVLSPWARHIPHLVPLPRWKKGNRFCWTLSHFENGCDVTWVFYVRTETHPLLSGRSKICARCDYRKVGLKYLHACRDALWYTSIVKVGQSLGGED